MKSIRAQRLKFLYDEPLRRHSVKAVKEVEDNIRLEHTIKPPIVPGEPLPPKHGMDHHQPWTTYLHSSNYNKSADVNQGKIKCSHFRYLYHTNNLDIISF